MLPKITSASAEQVLEFWERQSTILGDRISELFMNWSFSENNCYSCLVLWLRLSNPVPRHLVEDSASLVIAESEEWKKQCLKLQYLI